VTYLAQLTHRHFSKSPAFPFILSLIGLAEIALGIFFKRNSKKIKPCLSHLFPHLKR
jgi:hypothetical protein